MIYFGLDVSLQVPNKVGVGDTLFSLEVDTQIRSKCQIIEKKGQKRQKGKIESIGLGKKNKS